MSISDFPIFEKKTGQQDKGQKLFLYQKMSISDFPIFEKKTGQQDKGQLLYQTLLIP